MPTRDIQWIVVRLEQQAESWALKRGSQVSSYQEYTYADRVIFLRTISSGFSHRASSCSIAKESQQSRMKKRSKEKNEKCETRSGVPI